jgi:hypothetical protein
LTGYENFPVAQTMCLIMIDEVKNTLKNFSSTKEVEWDAKKVSQKYYFEAMFKTIIYNIPNYTALCSATTIATKL